jgi:phosphatidylserine/phosphatidylglycerophosphate/cardiolipin synthase-like enzyme
LRVSFLPFASVDQTPNLQATLLLNIQRRRDDHTASDELVRKFADRLWKKDWPGERQPDVFYDPRSLELDGPEGVLHAKAIVADDESAFVTSANLTEAAFDRNIEVGVLARDHALAASLSKHFPVLIERGLLLPLPAV